MTVRVRMVAPGAPDTTVINPHGPTTPPTGATSPLLVRMSTYLATLQIDFTKEPSKDYPSELNTARADYDPRGKDGELDPLVLAHVLRRRVGRAGWLLGLSLQLSVR